MEEDELHGYALGADDYITKPFSFPVLYAKAVSMMNRMRGHESFQMMRKKDIEANLRTGEVTVAGEECHLPKLEYEMLLYFLENANRILTREQLMVRFWGYDFDGNERIVDNHIKKLRKAIAGSECKIKTIHKTGYRLEVPL
jgi:DNA-binding response OmpR family regulator